MADFVGIAGHEAFVSKKELVSKPEAPLPHQGANLSVHYVGTLASNGQKFDSSVDKGRKFEFPLGEGQVIKGWDVGMATMRIGEKAILKIHPEYGYGARGAGGVIPPNAELLFEVEVFAFSGKDAGGGGGPPPSALKKPGQSQQQSQQEEKQQRNKKDDQKDGDLSSFIDEILKAPMDPLKTLAPGKDSLEYLAARAAPSAFASMGNFKAKLPDLIKLSDEAALQWKQHGNTEFQKKNHDLAVMHYTRGMMHVATKDMLATLLNNRSTVLFQIRRYRDSAIDANKALELKADYYKSLERRTACLKELGHAEIAAKDAAAFEAQDHSLATPTSDINSLLEVGNEGDNAPPPAVPVATLSTDVVQMAASDQKQRHLVAARKLDAGTTILVETPFAAAPLIEGMNVSCSHCFKRTSQLFPCRQHMEVGKRSRGLFCSDKCAALFWTAHGELESQNPYYLVCPVDSLLALRILRQKNAVSLPTDGTFDAAKFRGENIPDTFEAKFSSQYAETMVSFSSELYPNATVGGKETLLTSIALFFDVVDSETCERLVKAHRQVLVNSFVIRCSDRIINPAHPEQHSVVNMRLAKALYLVGSVANHSCDPNCAVHTKGEPFAASAQLHVQLTRPCMEGEELNICYENIHKNTNHSTRARIRSLRSQYGFGCICNACSNNVDEAVSKEDQEHYVKAADMFQKGRRLTREGQFEDSIATLGHSLDMVLEKICPPPRPPQLMVAKTHDAMAQSYQLLGNKEKCVQHLLASTEVLKIHHGDDDESLHREYVKLAMLYNDMGKTEEHAKYSDQAKQLLELHYPPSQHLQAELAFLLSTPQQKKAAGN